MNQRHAKHVLPFGACTGKALEFLPIAKLPKMSESTQSDFIPSQSARVASAMLAGELSAYGVAS